MSKSRVFTGKELIKVLYGFGFAVTRTKGSHCLLKHPDGRRTTIPVHGSEPIGIGLLYKILKDCELTINEIENK